MANAMKLTGGDEVVETVKFIDKFDKFFDCVNVSSLSGGKLSRNPFKSPYRSPSDFRLKVKNFIPYSWKIWRGIKFGGLAV